MNKKWIIIDENNKETKKHIQELEQYISLFCRKDKKLLTLYKAIATPNNSFAILVSTDLKNVYLEMDLVSNIINVKEKPDNVSWDEYFNTPWIMTPYLPVEEE